MTGWPAAAADAALHGPAGEFVLRTEPHSEAHPMALLAQFLVAFGTRVRTRRALRDRSGSSLSERVLRARRPVREGTQRFVVGSRPPRARRGRPGLLRGCLASGLSSGEGLIAQVRDARR